MAELPDHIFDQVEDLSEAGNDAQDRGDLEGAKAIWREALGLLPEPKLQWSAACWLYAATADVQRSEGDIEGSLASFQTAAAADGGAHDAFVQYGLGVSLLDLEREDEATDPLLRAYMLEGKEIFDGDDPKYFQHLVDRRLVR